MKINSRNFIVALVTIIVVIALLVVPGIIGGSIHSATVDSVIELVPPPEQSQVRVTGSAFQRGWFNSTAQLQVEFLPLLEMTAEPVTLLLDMDIRHGPVLFTREGLKWGLASADITPTLGGPGAEELRAEIPTDTPLPVLDGYMLAGFDQTLMLGVTLGAYEYSDVQGSIQFGGLDGSITFVGDSLRGFLVETGQLSLDVASEPFDLQIAPSRAESRFEASDQLVAPVSGSMEIPSISSTMPARLSITGMVMESSLNYSSPQQEQLAARHSIHIDNVEGVVPLSTFSWRTELNDIDRELAEGYYLLAENLGNVNSQGFGTDVLISNMESNLLQNPMELISRLQTNAYDGEHRVSIQVNWAGIAGARRFDNVPPAELFEALTASVELDVDEMAMGRSPLAGMVTPYIREGILVPENGRILIRGDLHNGTLVVNEQEFPLGDMFNQ
ncbi:MAG: DUF945 family protein [Pseudohongiellaceae bacterium]